MFTFIEERRVAKLVKQIKNIFDQELLVCIITETNQRSVRRSAIKNIKDVNVIETLALSNPDWRVRKAALSRVTNLEVLRKIAKNDPDKDIRLEAAELAGDPTDPKEEHFVLIHDQVLQFLRAYESELADEWYHYIISPSYEYVYDTCEYYIEFKIMLGNWWDSLMRNHIDVTDFMMNVFAFDPSERTFTKRIQVFTSKSGGQFDRVPEMIHKYLDRYETHDPGICLTKDKHGAIYDHTSR